MNYKNDKFIDVHNLYWQSYFSCDHSMYKSTKNLEKYDQKSHPRQLHSTTITFYTVNTFHTIIIVIKTLSLSFGKILISINKHENITQNCKF